MADYKVDPGPGSVNSHNDKYRDSFGIVFGDDDDASIVSDGTGIRIAGTVDASGLRNSGGHNVETLTGNRALASGDAMYQKLDPGGAGRDVTLPAEAISDGLVFTITNAADAAEALTVKDDTPATVVSIAQNERATVVCNGTTWIHMGIETIALS